MLCYAMAASESRHRSPAPHLVFGLSCLNRNFSNPSPEISGIPVYFEQDLEEGKKNISRDKSPGGYDTPRLGIFCHERWCSPRPCLSAAERSPENLVTRGLCILHNTEILRPEMVRRADSPPSVSGRHESACEGRDKLQAQSAVDGILTERTGISY